MNTYHSPEAQIHILARGLVFRGEHILICTAKESGKSFLPGGHVDNGERASEALKRELKEELGEHNYQVGELVGICETTFDRKEDVLQQEINFVYEVKVDEDEELVSQEEHLQFTLVNFEEFSKTSILPKTLHKALMEWLQSKKFFLV